MRPSSTVTLLAVAALMSACGKSDPTPSDTPPLTTIRCLWSDSCDQIAGTMTGTNITDLQTACTNSGGTPAVATCDTTAAVPGHCHYASTSMTGVTISGGYIDEYYYTAGGWTLLDAQGYCALPPAGTWVP